MHMLMMNMLMNGLIAGLYGYAIHSTTVIWNYFEKIAEALEVMNEGELWAIETFGSYNGTAKWH